MKKLQTLLLSFIFAALFSVTAFAAFPNEINEGDIALGGIQIGATEDYVKRIYGVPNDTSYDSNGVWGNVKIYNYGNSFFVSFSNGKVIEAKTTANNGITAPPGFTVGMPISRVENYYGANKGFAKKKGEYCRYNAKWLNISYEADHSGKINLIRIYQNP